MPIKTRDQLLDYVADRLNEMYRIVDDVAEGGEIDQLRAGSQLCAQLIEHGVHSYIGHKQD